METEIHQLLTCPVCLDRFKQPKLLPCQHTFCLKPCLQNLVADRTIRCPECRSIHPLPRGGVTGLPNNLTIIKFLDLKSYSKSRKSKNCQDCGESSEKRSHCNHCEKILCYGCLSKHARSLSQELKRSVAQVQKILPRVSETISDIEERIGKSQNTSKLLQGEIIQSVERCIAEITARKQMLIEEVETLIGAETRSLQVEQENLEVEFATMTSFCENAQQRSEVIMDAINSGSLDTVQEQQSEMLQMSRLGKEHIRSTRVAMSNAEDKIARTTKFRNEGERSLLCSISRFGDITIQSPSRMSMTFGSDLALNDAEIERVMQVEYSPRYGRRSTQQVDLSVPTFHSPSSNEADSPAPTARSFDSAMRSNNNNNTPQRPPQRRTQGGNNGRRNGSQHPSYLTVGNRSRTPPSDQRPLHVTGMRTVLWQYRSKERVKQCFGMKGSDIGCLNWPRGVAVTASDQIVVADSSNHRVQVFDFDGAPILQFGSYGSAPGEFDCLAGICVTSQGWIITADRYNHRIQIFDSGGRFIRKFGEEGSGEGELSYPWGVATDSMGFIYVCDKDNHRIQVFTLDGGFIRKFGRVGSYDAQFDSPQYLTVTHDNKIVVSDSGNHRIQVFDKYGRFLYKFGTEGSSTGCFKYPRGVACDRHGNIIVGDSGNNRVQVFRGDGSYIASFGKWGSEPGQIKGLEGVALKSNNEVVLSDRENHRIQVLDSFASEIGSTLDDLNLHFDDEDDLYLTQDVNRGSFQSEMEGFPYNKARPLNFTNPVYFLLNGHNIQPKEQKMKLIPLSQFDINQDNDKISRKQSKRKKESFMHSITGFMHKKHHKKSSVDHSEITPPLWTDGPAATVEEATTERRSSDFVRRRESIPVDDKSNRSQSLETPTEIPKVNKSPTAKIPPKKSPRLSRVALSSRSSNDESTTEATAKSQGPSELKPEAPRVEEAIIDNAPKEPADKLQSDSNAMPQELETSSMYSYILNLKNDNNEHTTAPSDEDAIPEESSPEIGNEGELKRNKTVKWAGSRAAPTLIREFTKKNKNRKILPSDSAIQPSPASTPVRNLSSDDVGSIPETTSTEDLLAKVSLEIEVVDKPKNKRETSAFTILSQCLPPAPKLLRSESTKVRSYLHKMGSSEQYALGYAVTEFTRQTEKTREPRPLVLLHNIRSFMTDMKRYLMTNPHVGLLKRINKLSKDITKVDVEGAVDDELDRLVLHPLYKLICNCLVRDYNKTKQLDRIKDALAVAKTKPPNELGIRETLIPPDDAGINEIRGHFKSLQSTFSPYYKLKHLLLAVTAIYKHTQDLNCEDKSSKQIGADDFLPLLVYTIVKCEFVAADIEAQYIDGLLDPVLLLGEGGYYLTTLFSAVQVINSMRRKQSALPHISDLQSFLQVGIAATDKLISPKLSAVPHHKTLHVPPSMTARSLSAMIARKYEVMKPDLYFLHVVVNGSTLELKPNEFPQLVKMDLLSQFEPSAFYFVYQLKEQTVAMNDSNEEVFVSEERQNEFAEIAVPEKEKEVRANKEQQISQVEDIYSFADDYKAKELENTVLEAQDSVDDVSPPHNTDDTVFQDTGISTETLESLEELESLDKTLTDYEADVTITNEEETRRDSDETVKRSDYDNNAKIHKEFPEDCIDRANNEVLDIETPSELPLPVKELKSIDLKTKPNDDQMGAATSASTAGENHTNGENAVSNVELPKLEDDRNVMESESTAIFETEDGTSENIEQQSETIDVPHKLNQIHTGHTPVKTLLSPIPVEELPSPPPVLDIDALPSPPPQSVIAQSWDSGLDTVHQIPKPDLTKGRKIIRHVSVSDKSDIQNLSFDTQKYKTMSKDYKTASEVNDPSEQTVSKLRKYFEAQANQE